MTRRMPVILLLIWLAWAPDPALGGLNGDDFNDFSEIDLTELLNQVVVTAARRPQTISESPAAVTVITAQDIRRSGATSIPDALRMIPGLGVMMATAGDFNVSARGINGLNANQMLVMIDGRYAYDDFYGSISWGDMPIGLDDIQHIEVIRGPGSALYGANAFSGIINIITRSDPSRPRGSMTLKAGEDGVFHGSLLQAGTRGPWIYKASVGTRHAPSWTDPELDGIDRRQIDGRVAYVFSPTRRLTLSGGLSDGTTLINVMGGAGLNQGKATSRNLKLDYRGGGLQVQIFWFASNPLLTPIDSTIADFLTMYQNKDTYDAELQHTYHLSDSHVLVSGGNIRINTIDSNLLDDRHQQNLYALFLHDEFHLSERLIIAAGGRLDYHPLVKSRFSPRGSVVFKPRDGHVLRAYCGTAYRNPTLSESYWSMTMNHALLGQSMIMYGNKNLEPERATSIGCGYQAAWSERLVASATLFHNRMRDLINPEILATFPAPPAPPGIPAEITWSNMSSWDAAGFETCLDLRPAHWIRSQINYAYLQIEDTNTGQSLEEAPRHRINAALQLQAGRRAVFDLRAHWTDETTWLLDTLYGAVGPETIEAFTLLTARVGYQVIHPGCAIAVSCFNLLGEEHREHPQAEAFGRRYLAELRVDW